jgi:hypothetical protein
MISPLGQRQILQTLAVETAKAALEGGAQVQREQAQRQSFNARLSEAMLDVVDVAEADPLKLAEHGEQKEGKRSKHGTGASEGEGEEEPENSRAEGAEHHLDLLA